MRAHRQNRFLATVAIAMLVSACAGSGAATPTVSTPATDSAASFPPAASAVPYADLLEEAAAEGTVTFAMPTSQEISTAEVTRRMEEGVSEMFGVDISITLDSSLNYSAAMAKVITEVQADSTPTYDLLWQDTGTVQPAIDADALQDFEWETLFPWVDPRDLQFDGLVLSPAIQVTLPAYNTEVVQPGEITSWESLLDPKWKGQIGTTVYNEPWAPLAHDDPGWGEARLYEFMEGLAAQDPVLGRYAEVHDKLVSGEISVMAIDFTEWVETDAAKGAPVAIAEVEPVIEVILVAAIPKLAENANAAALLTGWLLSPEGQEFLDEAFTASPYHAGTKAAALLEGKPTVNMLGLDVTAIAKNLDDILIRGTSDQ